jgi:predicted ATPase/DNA-binding winged helix-turn-helix (wHTH) protein
MFSKRRGGCAPSHVAGPAREAAGALPRLFRTMRERINVGLCFGRQSGLESAMQQANHGARRLRFGVFEADLRAGELTKQGSRLRLQEQPFQLLVMLLEKPGELVTREELRNRLWSGTIVDFDHGVNKAINKIRGALGDSAESPRFVETVARRGYRFLASVTPIDMAASRRPSPETNAYSSSPLPAANFAEGVVGRNDALGQMQSWLDKMLHGERQTVFVTGEAGIGKTALVDTFIHGTTSNRHIRVGRGQCLEHYGKAEAYLPVLDAIGRLCRAEGHLVGVLRSHAPMWLLQMPSLLSASDRELLGQEVIGATRERMLREMGGALDALTADLPLVLILEDLHWSDYSTLDLISYLARQRQAAQLMLIGTYRIAELISSGHPLMEVKQELLAKQQCKELPLEYLNKDAIAKYLSFRFPSNRFPPGLATLIHERTEGNSLFMVSAVDYLVAEELIVENAESWDLVVDIEKVEVGVPDSIKQMIEKQVNHLDAEERRTLEAASVAGAEFSTLAVAAALEEDQAPVEARCDVLTRRRQFIQDCGVQELNGHAVARYGFIHALYQNVLYESVSASRRVQLHRRIGEEGEQLYGDRAKEVAAELAMHFERAANYKQAAKYLQQAADNAIRRFAYREAVALSRRGLELLRKLPDTPERAQQELSLQLTLGVPLIATEGYAASDVGSVYLKARELYQQLGDTSNVSEILWGLWTFHTLRAELGKGREIAEEFLRLAERLPYPDLAMRGHWALEITFMHLGEFALAMEHFEKALSLYDPEHHRDDAFRLHHPVVAIRCFAAWALWFLGQPDQALDRIQEALTLARKLSDPHGLAHALLFAAMLHQLRQEGQLAQVNADAAFAVSSEHGLAMYQAMATVVRGWAQFRQGRREEGIEQMRLGLAALQATGTELLRPTWLGLLAEALGKNGQTEEGLRLLEEGLGVAQRNGERYSEAELYRIKGEVLVVQSIGGGVSRTGADGKTAVEARRFLVAQAEGCFKQAIKIAQQQRARSWELRAVTSLARLHRNQGKQGEARNLLARTYRGFTEGFATTDLCEAKALLDELS